MSGKRFDVKVIGPPFAASGRRCRGANGAAAAAGARRPPGAPSARVAAAAAATRSPRRSRAPCSRSPSRPGADVQEGALVCVIEAMKMENEITAHKAGTVSELPISVGASVAPRAVDHRSRLWIYARAAREAAERVRAGPGPPRPAQSPRETDRFRGGAATSPRAAGPNAWASPATRRSVHAATAVPIGWWGADVPVDRRRRCRTAGAGHATARRPRRADRAEAEGPRLSPAPMASAITCEVLRPPAALRATPASAAVEPGDVRSWMRRWSRVRPASCGARSVSAGSGSGRPAPGSPRRAPRTRGAVPGDTGVATSGAAPACR